MPDARRVVAAVLAALAWSAAAAAQVPPGATAEERALLVRADSLWSQVQVRVERKRQADRERFRGRLVESAGLAVVVPGRTLADQAARGLDTVRAMLRGFGGVPEGFERSVVVVLANATDTALALAAPIVRGRQRVSIGGIQQSATKGGGTTVNLPALAVATAIAWAYRETRDADWRTWLPPDCGVGPWTRNATWNAFESLTRSPWGAGSRCLAGDVRGCRLWLGLDRDSSPFRARYDANELRDFFDRYGRWMAERSPAGRDCLSGAGTACIEYAREGHHPLSPIPADETGRRSLVRAVLALHGPGSLGRALADTAGSVGERFARAAGIGEDSLVREWRYWVLTRGGRPEDRNLLADAAPGLLLAGLLLAAARRSRG